MARALPVPPRLVRTRTGARPSNTFALLALLATGCVRPAEPPLRTNVLLISLDSTRRDLVGTYSPGLETTPTIDRLAREGALFEAASSTTSWTLPAHLSLLTGQPGLVHAVELVDYRLDKRLLTLAERLQPVGYRTAGFYSGPYLDPRFGFGRGFERYESCYGSELAYAAERAAETSTELAALPATGRELERLAAWERDVEAQRALEIAAQRDVSSRQVVDRALTELDEAAADGRPFFLFTHLFDPHYDYVPPPPFDTRFDPEYDGALDGREFFRNPAVSVPDAEQPSGRRRTISERDLEHVRALYAGELAATDRELARLIQRLEALNLLDRTVVIVVGDHGDEFFEHDGLGHRRTLYEEVLAVPLVVRFPPRIAAGTRIAEPVSLVDVAPTVLELIGLPPSSELTSRSLVAGIERAVARRASPDPAPNRGVFARLVRTEPTEVRIQDGEDVLHVPVDRVLVTEVFRHGSIKITRERRWIRPPGNLDPDVLALLRDESRRQRAEETLHWIDLALHPDEPAAQHSTDFEDPAARAALAAFTAHYLVLLERRTRAQGLHDPDDLAPALRGLGYATSSDEAGLSRVSTDEFSLPRHRTITFAHHPSRRRLPLKAKLLLRVLTPPVLLCSLAASAAAGDAGSIATFATRLAYDCITLPSSERTFVLTSVGEAENPLIQSSSGEIFVPRSFDLGSADLWKLAVKNEDSGAAEFGDLLTFTPSDPNITFTSAGPVKRNLDPHNLAAGQQVEFFWNGIEHASAPGELFDVWVRAEVRQGERYARLFSGVVNHSSVWSTYQYTFPYVEVETAGDPVAHRLTLPIQSGLILRNPVQNLPFFFFLEPDPAQSQFLLPPNHPGWLTMQWLGFWESTEPDQRLFYWSMLDGGADGEAGPWGKSVSFTTDPGAGSFTIAVTTRPEFNTTPGGTYVVDFPVAVGVLRGDWYDAALEYREWAEEQVWTQNGPLATNPRLSDEIREADMLGIATCTSCCNPTPVAPACPGGTFNDCNPTLPGTQVLTTEFSSWSGWRAEVEDHINYFGPDRMISSAYEWDLESFNNLVWGSWLEATPDQPVAEFAQGALDLLGAVSQYTWGFYFALDSYDSQAVGYDSLYIDGPLQGSSVEDFVVMDEDGTMLPEGADLSKFRHADCGVAPTGLCADSLKVCFSTSFPLEYLKHFVGVLSAYGANGTYLDGFYARQQYCYDATHGHPLGGGRHWGQGKVDLIKGVRDYARNELGLTDFHVGLEWPLEAAIGETDFVWDGIGKWADITFNAPLFTTVYHRYIRVGTAGVNHSFDSDKIDTWFRARLRFAERLHSGFVPSGGVVLRSVFLEDDLVDPAYPHYQQYLAYVKDYMDLLKQGAAREVMTFGERLRDPVNHADLVTFRDVTGPQVFYLLYGWEQPAAYVSAWRSDDGSLGFLVTNWTDVDDDEETLPGDTEFWGTTSPGDQTFTFSIDPKAYGLADGTHRFAEITAAGTTPGTITFNQGATKRVTVTVPERSSKFLHLRP